MLNRKCIILVLVGVLFSEMSKAEWKRPTKIGKEWLKSHDTNVKYSIKDIPPNDYKMAAELMAKSYMTGEPLYSMFHVASDPNSVKFLEKQLLAILKQKISIAAYELGTNKMIGLNLLYVVQQNDAPTDATKHIKSGNLKKTQEVLGLVEPTDVFGILGANKYLKCSGMWVDSDYFGNKIGDNLILSRKDMFTEYQLTVTTGIYSTTFSNQFADALNFYTHKSIPYDSIIGTYTELQGINGTVLTFKSNNFQNA
ncbi:uncharacterized protein LOC116344502 [Contarinia nasturtii]|uniref:uncharacterized protein LOC116344502 n=1 Tax=Contarinia nasturtii TaxID=265458 RepID=UPI0012D452EF|nr:uncharacterized protein LOC116344502 [Contarinia nasturtii]